MAGLYAHYEADLVADVLMAEGFTVRIRSVHHPKMRALTQHQLRKYRSYLNSTAPIPHAIEEQMEIERAECAIEGWSGEGAVDREGQPMPFTPENVRQVLGDPKMVHFRKDVLLASTSITAFQRQELAELGKASSLSSGPTSSGPTAGTPPAA